MWATAWPSLVSERNDITVIDTDAERLEDLQNRFDLRGVVGNGTDVRVLAEAGAADTDLLIACAALDETNLVCCKLAHMAFGIPARVARVRSTAFEHDPRLLSAEGFAVDAVVCPEISMTRYIRKLIEYPDSLQVREFAGGRACLSSVRARAGAAAVGMRIGDLRVHNPELGLRIVAIYRRFADEPDRFVRCDGATRIEPGDEVFVLAAREHLRQVLEAFHLRMGQVARQVRRILISGGSRVSLQLAQSLVAEPGRFHVKIIESDAKRCEELAAALPSEVLVLHGSPTDEDLFADENVDETDLFSHSRTTTRTTSWPACWPSAWGQPRAGADQPPQLCGPDARHADRYCALACAGHAGEFLAYVRKGDVQAVHSLRRGVAEALEIVARGDRRSSKWWGARSVSSSCHLKYTSV